MSLQDLTPEQLRKLQDSFKKHIEEETKKNVAIFDKTLDAVVDKLSSDGWTLPAELGIYAVNVIGQTDKIEDINSFLCDYFTREDYLVTRKMIDSILHSSIRESLKKLVQQCWDAFQNKLYAVCATSLLSVIEGVLSEFGDDKRDVRMMRICQYHVDNFPPDGSTIEKHVWISYNTFIRNLYQKSDFNDDEPDEINRHWLLHGRSDFEQDEIDCIRLFNAVQSLCMIVNQEAKRRETTDNQGTE